MKVGDLLLVEWVDSHHQPGWTSEIPDGHQLVCHSVGWLVKTSNDTIVLAPNKTIEDSPQRCGLFTIAIRSIIHRVTITQRLN